MLRLNSKLGIAIASTLGGGAASNPLRFATPQNFLPTTNGVVPNAARLSARGRIPFYIGSTDQSQLVLSYIGWYLSGSGPAALANGYTITKVSIEKDGATSSVPVTFSGSRTKTINPGEYDIQSDPILPASFGLGQFTYGNKYWYRFEYVVTTGQRMPDGVQSYTGWGGLPSAVSLFIDPATTDMSPVDSYGNMTFSTGWDNGYSNASLPFFLGRAVSGDIRSILAAGDSITSNALSGFTRSLFGTDLVSNPIAGANFGRGGSSGNMWSSLSPSTAIYMQHYLQYAKYVVDAYGTNAFITSPGFLALEQTSAQAIWTACDTYGVETILRPKLIPRTTGDATTPLNAAWASGGGARQFNDWLDTQTSRVQIIVRDSLRVSSNQSTDGFYQWTGGSTNTADYTHPNTAGNILDAADYRAAYVAYLP